MKEKKVFYIGCKEFFYVDIAKKLRKKELWQPVYWTANDEHKAAVIKNFPEIIFLKNSYAVRGYIPQALENEFKEFTSQLKVKKLLKIRKISNYMLERFNWNDSFSSFEKEELVNFHLAYADFITEKFNPEVVIFEEVPHFVYDYILYEICKIKKIKTIIFAFSNISGYSFVIDNIWSTSKKLKYNYENNLKNKNFIRLEKFEQEYLRIKNVENSEPASEKWVQKRAQMNLSNLNIFLKIKKIFFQDTKATLINIKKIFQKNTKTSAANMKLKNKNFKEFPTYMKIFYNIKKSEYKTLKLQNRYHKISTKNPDLTKNYINFFLHYEPERSISPQVGLLFNQIEIANYIAKKLPNNWYLYVKEHRKTFNTHLLMRYQYRKIQDYLKLINQSNIILINESYPSLNLLKNAKANITGNGTAGLESIIHLKPLMTFGYSWLNKFKYCLNIRTKKNLEKSLQMVVNEKIKFSDNDVKVFLNALEKSCYNIYHTSSLKYDDDIRITESTNSERIYDAIIDYYKNWL